jgi:hypothetical protein
MQYNKGKNYEYPDDLTSSEFLQFLNKCEDYNKAIRRQNMYVVIVGCIILIGIIMRLIK